MYDIYVSKDYTSRNIYMNIRNNSDEFIDPPCPRSVAECFYFRALAYGHHENNDHLFGLGQVKKITNIYAQYKVM